MYIISYTYMLKMDRLYMKGIFYSNLDYKDLQRQNFTQVIK